MPNAPCAACGGCDVVGMLAEAYSNGGQWWLCMDCGLEWVTEDGRPCPKCQTPMEARCGTPDVPGQPDNYDGQTWAYGCPVCDFGDAPSLPRLTPEQRALVRLYAARRAAYEQAWVARAGDGSRLFALGQTTGVWDAIATTYPLHVAAHMRLVGTRYERRYRQQLWDAQEG